ncbi:hypothetical protein F5Y09DRAFT_307093 [Xylaria sp. FL1042]|nr:hypothetical protein F5Y09DRAFT_307093 [Xylaria sp. FL1042]
MQQERPRGHPSPNVYGGYPPPSRPTPQQHKSFNQDPEHGALAPRVPATTAVPGGLELFFFRDRHNTQIIKAAGHHDALLAITLPRSNKPELQAHRGHTSGETIAMGQLHGFTTSKADMTLWGRHERWKKEYDSFTGLGHLCWEPTGEEGFLLEGNGRMLARYKINIERRKRLKKEFLGSLGIAKQVKLLASSSNEIGLDGLENESEARLEVYAQGLSREQLEEIIISCVVERERFKKNRKNKKDGEIAGELLGGLGDLAGA